MKSKRNEDNFELIPAIDILGGKCVRLTKGMYNKVEEYSKNPVEIAKKWLSFGAKRLHIIDLDGAKEGYPVNFKVIAKIASGTNAILQVGGGVRTHEVISNYLSCGINYLIIGTKAFEDKGFLTEVVGQYGDKIIVSLDIKRDKVALSGWQETLNVDLSKLSLEFKDIKQVIYTDTNRDGTLSGPNLESLEGIAALFKSKVFVSGGVSKVEDILEILKIKKSSHPNINGVILGKSLYEGTIDLANAIGITNKELRYSSA